MTGTSNSSKHLGQQQHATIRTRLKVADAHLPGHPTMSLAERAARHLNDPMLAAALVHLRHIDLIPIRTKLDEVGFESTQGDADDKVPLARFLPNPDIRMCDHTRVLGGELADLLKESRGQFLTFIVMDRAMDFGLAAAEGVCVHCQPFVTMVYDFC